MIGEFCFVIILRSEIPDTMPTLWLVVNFLVESFPPLPGTGTLDLRITTVVKDFTGTHGFISVGGKMGGKTDMLLKKPRFF